MTTISDPLGTPTVVYNRAGTAIVELVFVGSSPPPVNIPRVCGHMVAVVVDGWGALILPANAEIGDVVEIHTNTNQCTASPPAGETLGVGTNAVFITTDFGRWYRKVRSDHWVAGGAV